MDKNPFKRKPEFFWRPEFSVKVQQLDDQHKILIGMLNQAADLVDQSETPYRIGILLDAMDQYAILHFSTEERLMLQCGAEGYEAQKKEHEFFFSEIKRFRTAYTQGGSPVHQEMSDFLRSWFIAHVQRLDSKYAETMNLAGIR